MTTVDELLMDPRFRRGNQTTTGGLLSRPVPQRPRGNGDDYNPLEDPDIMGDAVSGGGGGGGGVWKNLMSFPGGAWGAIKGLPTFGGKLVQTGVGLGEFVVDTGADIIPGVEYTSRWERDKEKAKALGLSGVDQVAYAAQRQYPLASMIIPSVVNTGAGATELATFGKLDFGEPGVDYANAWRRGEAGRKLFEDLGNLLLVGRVFGAGNVIARGGETAAAAGMPRLGRVVSTTGRLIEEPIGTPLRGLARIGEAGASYRGMPQAEAAFGRIARAGLRETAGPIRQTIGEVISARRASGMVELNTLLQELDQLQRERDAAPEAEKGAIQSKMNEVDRRLRTALNKSGIPKDAKRKILEGQRFEEPRRTVFQTEAARLRTLGPSIYYPEVGEGPLPDFASPVATMIMTGNFDIVKREIARGATPAEAAAIISTAGAGPDIQPTFTYGAADVEAALRYDRGEMNPFDRRSVDSVLTLMRTASEEFTKGQLSGEYRLGGPMPESYTGRYPLADFIVAELDRGSFRRADRVGIARALDKVAVEFMDTLPPELRKQFKFTVDDPTGAFKALVELPADHPLATVAQQMIELLFPQLLQQFPGIMRDPRIFPAQERPAIFSERRAMRRAQAADIDTIVVGMNQIADAYKDVLNKKFVESLRNDLEQIVGSPRQYTEGAYRNILGKVDRLINALKESIVEMRQKGRDLSAEQQALLNKALEAEQTLGAMRATIATVVDNIAKFDDPTLREAQAELTVKEAQVESVKRAIEDVRRNDQQLQTTPDGRQQIVDDIDAALAITDGLEYADELDALIEEFDFRRRAVEAGQPDPTEVVPKPYTNRSKEVKAARDEMLRVAEDAETSEYGQLEMFQTAGIISWNAWAVDSKNIFGMPLRNYMIQELSRYVGPVEAEKIADGWAGSKYSNEGHVYVEDPWGIQNDKGVGPRGLDDFIEYVVDGEIESPPRTPRGDEPRRAGDTEWGAYIRKLADAAKATEEVKRIKKMRLYEIAEEMNRTRESRDFTSSGIPLPILARAIAYATNNKLLAEDLRRRDQLVADMEAGVPYEGAEPRLVPIPKGLLTELVQAEKDVAKQQKTVEKIRREGTAEQRRMARAQLKGVAKIVEQADGTLEGQMLKGPQTKAEMEIEQLTNKAENRRIKLDELRKKYQQETALLAATQQVQGAATAVGEYLAQPFGPLLNPERQTSYLPTGLPRGVRAADSVPTELRREGAAPQVASPVEQMRTSDLMPLRLEDMARRFDEIFSVTGRNSIIESIIRDQAFSTTAGRLLTADVITKLEQQARKSVEAQTGLIRTPGEIDLEVRKQTGLLIGDAIRKLGFEAVSPVKIDPETGGHQAVGDLMQTVASQNIDANTIVMRKGLREQIVQTFVPRRSSNAPQAGAAAFERLQRATGTWKGTVLPFSLRWQIGDFVSNVLNGWARGDVNPVDMARTMIEVDQRLKESGSRLEALDASLKDDLLSVLIGAGLQARGIRDVDLRVIRGMAQDIPLDYEFKYVKWRSKAFRFNEYQNTVARAAVAILKLEEALAKQGRTIEMVNARVYMSDPVIRDAINGAVSETNRALGAFSELNPFEKKVMRNIFPFWSWIKYINMAALDMAIDNPERLLLAAHLGNIASSPEQEGLFRFLQGMTPAMGYLFDLSFLNPYSDALILTKNPLREAGDMAFGVNPVIMTPYKGLSAAFVYADAGELPGARVQRPGYLEGSADASTRTLADLVGELGYMGLQSFGGPARNVLTLLPNRVPVIAPEGRLLGTDVAVGNVQRYPQGSPRTTGAYSTRRLGPVASRVGAVLGAFGVPRPLMEEDLANQLALLQQIEDIKDKARRDRERLRSFVTG